MAPVDERAAGEQLQIDNDEDGLAGSVELQDTANAADPWGDVPEVVLNLEAPTNSSTAAPRFGLRREDVLWEDSPCSLLSSGSSDKNSPTSCDRMPRKPTLLESANTPPTRPPSTTIMSGRGDAFPGADRLLLRENVGNAHETERDEDDFASFRDLYSALLGGSGEEDSDGEAVGDGRASVKTQFSLDTDADALRMQKFLEDSLANLETTKSELATMLSGRYHDATAGEAYSAAELEEILVAEKCGATPTVVSRDAPGARLDGQKPKSSCLPTGKTATRKSPLNAFSAGLRRMCGEAAKKEFLRRRADDSKREREHAAASANFRFEDLLKSAEEKPVFEGSDLPADTSLFRS